MSIKDFYVKLGNLSLNFSLYFILLAMFLTIFLINLNQPVIAAGFLLILSLIYYRLHIHYIKKSKLVKPFLHDAGNHEILTPYLTEKINRHLYFFSPDGHAHFHTRNLFKKIELYDHTTGALTIQAIKEKRENYNIYEPNQKWVGTMYFDKQSSLVEIQIQQKEIMMIKNSNNEFHFYRNSQKIAEIKKGWLPLKWTSLFRLNIPVITFQEKASKLESAAIMLATSLIINN